MTGTGTFLIVREHNTICASSQEQITARGDSRGLPWREGSWTLTDVKASMLESPEAIDTSLKIAHEVKGLAWTSRSASPSQDDRSGLSLQQSCRVWPSSKRLDAYVRDAHEAYVLGGCLGHTL
jgi:hypothetical protein